MNNFMKSDERDNLGPTKEESMLSDIRSYENFKSFYEPKSNGKYLSLTKIGLQFLGK